MTRQPTVKAPLTPNLTADQARDIQRVLELLTRCTLPDWAADPDDVDQALTAVHRLGDQARTRLGSGWTGACLRRTAEVTLPHDPHTRTAP